MTSHRTLKNRIEELEMGDVPTVGDLVREADGARLRFADEEAPDPDHARVREADGSLSPFYFPADRIPDAYVRVSADADGDHDVYAHPDHVGPEDLEADHE